MYILIHPAYMHVLTSSVNIFRGFQLLLSYEQMELKLRSSLYTAKLLGRRQEACRWVSLLNNPSGANECNCN